jgi:hypothetical protein
MLRHFLKPLLDHVRLSNVELSDLMQVVLPTGLVDYCSLFTASVYRGIVDSAESRQKFFALQSHFPANFAPRLRTFCFEPPSVEGTFAVSPCGSKFINHSDSKEASATTMHPVFRVPNDPRKFSFFVKFDMLPTADSEAANSKKTFFGIGLIQKKVSGLQEPIQSRENGILYYCNGWISSYGETKETKDLQKREFDVGDTVGFEVDLALNTIMFMKNGQPVSESTVLLKKLAQDYSELYPVVRLKTNSYCVISE